MAARASSGRPPSRPTSPSASARPARPARPRQAGQQIGHGQPGVGCVRAEQQLAGQRGQPRRGGPHRLVQHRGQVRVHPAMLGHQPQRDVAGRVPAVRDDDARLRVAPGHGSHRRQFGRFGVPVRRVPGVQHDRQRHRRHVLPDRVEAPVVGREVTHRAVQLEHPQAEILHRRPDQAGRVVIGRVHGAAADHPQRAVAVRGGQLGHGPVQLGGRAGPPRVGQRPRLTDPLGGQPLTRLSRVGRVGEPVAREAAGVEEIADRGLQPGRQQVDVSVDGRAGHPSGLPGPRKRLTPGCRPGKTHGNRQLENRSRLMKAVAGQSCGTT